MTHRSVISNLKSQISNPMTIKRTLTIVSILSAAAVAAVATVALVVPPGHHACMVGGMNVLPAKAGTPARAGTEHSVLSTEYSVLAASGSANVTLAAQKARFALSDGRTATFSFATAGGTLTAHAAVGLDQECNFALLPLADPLSPSPTPDPEPRRRPAAAARSAAPPHSNLRVLFTYDPNAPAGLAHAARRSSPRPSLAATWKSTARWIRTAPVACVRSMRRTPPSYRFLPSAADAAQLPAVWQGIFNAARAKPVRGWSL